MEPAEPLTAEEKSLLHNRLLELREALQRSIAAAREGTKPVELDQGAVGRVSRIDAIAVQQMAKASLQSQQLRLQQVHQALMRFERDEYGACLRCEEPVGFARLEVAPETALCLHCQRERESGAR